MKKIFLLTLLFTFNFTYLLAQMPSWLWSITNGGTGSDRAYSIAIDNSANIIVTGWYTSNTLTIGSHTLTNSNGWAEIFIVKYDNAGNVLWAKSAGGSNDDYAHGVATDANGNIYITGHFKSNPINFGTFTLNKSGIQDVFLAKLDSSGNFLWVKSAGNTVGNYSADVVTDLGGNVFITGSLDGPSLSFDNITLNNKGGSSTTAGRDAFVVKYDSLGNVVWATNFGGTDDDYASSISVDINDNIIITGSFKSPSVTFGSSNLANAGMRDIFIAKYDASGNPIWAKSVGGTSNESGNSVATDAIGNIVIAGGFSSNMINLGTTNLFNGGSIDMFVASYDSSGNLLWADNAAGADLDQSKGVATDLNNDVFVTGYFSSTTISFGSIILTGTGNSDLFVAKYSSSGNVIWAESAIGSGTDFAEAIVIDPTGNALITGEFLSNPISFGSTIHNNSGSYDFYIAKIGTNCTPPSITTTTTDPLCYGGTGSATVTPTGNVPFTYSWSNGQTTQTATGLPAGTHTVTVTDDSSCAAIATVTITEPAAIVSNISSIATNFTSPNCNGSVAINPSGGTPPYSISWNSGTTTNLCEGWYTATITDANNCVVTDSVYVNFVTGIEELNAAGISVYPNPVKDVLFISSEKGEIGDVRIYDIMGNLIKHIFSSEKKIYVELNINAGVYLVEIKEFKIKIIKP
jgi:hypothetical protein